jgi:hypothetical protein
MKKFRFHYSIKEYYFEDFEAETMEEAIEQLKYCGVNFQDGERSDFFDNANILPDDESWENKKQWEIIGEDVSNGQ